jgi:membrane-associated protein
MDALQFVTDILFNLRENLDQWTLMLGLWLYLLLFLVVFAETGLVVTPFLPGDSLLFALGALAATGPLDIWLLLLLLALAAVLGDAVNYAIGRHLGPKVFHREDSRFLNKAHLVRTQHFYEKYGGKTIVLARFVPIVRTFAPFVAGIGKMSYRRFATFNVTGGIAWVGVCLFSGYWFGNLPWVNQHFELVVVGIVLVSVMPMVVEYLLAQRRTRQALSTEAPHP